MTFRAAWLLAMVTCCCAQQVDLVLKNGRVVTLDRAKPEVRAIAMNKGRVVAVGSDAEIAKYSAARTIDLKGALAIPGFIEGHGHFMGLGESKMNLNLREARNWEQIVSMVRAAAREAKAGEWILGRGWHQSKWDHVPQPNVHGFPVADEITRAAPDNPVWLTHASGHASIVNGAALSLAGIDAKTKNPPGGEILKDTAGNPTGLLNETAQGLLRRAFSDYMSKQTPAQRAERSRKQVQLAADECLSKGITSFQDAGSSFETVDLLKSLAAGGKLPLRLWLMLRASTAQLAEQGARYRMVDFGDAHLTVRGIKRAIDGALGSRGAWLLEPYADLPSSSGLNTDDPADLRKVAEYAIQNGFQFCVHAIGDRANRETLDIFEAAFKAHPGRKDVRWRIEHAQHISAADIPRFGKLGVIASMQGVHCTSDAPYVLARLGPKRAEEGAYVWRKLMSSGAIVTNGTDAPVEDVDPIASFHATVSRKLKDGSVFYPSQRLTREEALRTYTVNNAIAAFEEKDKGTLAAGMLADVTVLSKDILRIAEDEIPAARVLYTIVGGKVRYETSPR
jgi:predicted amidohydrolase YtcJ